MYDFIKQVYPRAMQNIIPIPITFVPNRFYGLIELFISLILFLKPFFQ